MSAADETREVLLSLLKEKGGDDEAIAFIEKLISVNETTVPQTVENQGHLQELWELYEEFLFCIRTNPGAWYEKLGGKSRKRRRKTSYRVGFDGITQKRVTDEKGETKVFKKEHRGEFMPVSSDKAQLNDTAVLLKLVASEDYATIESLGYKIKKRDTDQFK